MIIRFLTLPGRCPSPPGAIPPGVEKFLPEREGAYYCLRQWIFFGDHEISRRLFANSPIVKARNTVHREEGLPVPEALRALRTRLQFDYGKFDYAFVDGRTVLYDVNRTPAVGRTFSGSAGKSSVINELAQGLFAFLIKRRKNKKQWLYDEIMKFLEC
jgi:hypothetical protein